VLPIEATDALIQGDESVDVLRVLPDDPRVDRCTDVLDAREVLVDLVSVPDERAPEGLLVPLRRRERQMVVEVHDLRHVGVPDTFEDEVALRPEGRPDGALAPALETLGLHSRPDAGEVPMLEVHRHTVREDEVLGLLGRQAEKSHLMTVCLEGCNALQHPSIALDLIVDYDRDSHGSAFLHEGW